MFLVFVSQLADEREQSRPLLSDLLAETDKHQVIVWQALLHFRSPPIVVDDSSWKNAAESFTVALTLP